MKLTTSLWFACRARGETIQCGRTIKKKLCQRFGDWNAPTLNEISEEDLVFGLSVDDVTGSIPTHDQRRRILATDSLASVEGVRVMVELTLQHLFGMNCCSNCQNFSESSSPCQDLFGSSARAEGGIFGRTAAVFTSIELQKSTGSLHAHSKVSVQCLHQHQPVC